MVVATTVVGEIRRAMLPVVTGSDLHNEFIVGHPCLDGSASGGIIISIAAADIRRLLLQCPVQRGHHHGAAALIH